MNNEKLAHSLPSSREELKKLSRSELFTAIIDRRKALRTHRDQVGDDRCWLDDYLLFAFVDGLESKMVKPDYEAGMKLCTDFYNNCRVDRVLPQHKHAALEPKLWNKDLLGMDESRLLSKLERIQNEIVVLYNVIKRRRPRVADYLRLYKRTLPDGIMPDMRLPSEKEFLGVLTQDSGCPQKSAGCPQFWMSHHDCPPEICNPHQWGPCTLAVSS